MVRGLFVLPLLGTMGLILGLFLRLRLSELPCTLGIVVTRQSAGLRIGSTYSLWSYIPQCCAGLMRICRTFLGWYSRFLCIFRTFNISSSVGIGRPGRTFSLGVVHGAMLSYQP